MPAIIVGGAILVFFVLGVAVMIARFYRKVDQGRALIINKMRAEPEVTFTGGTVLPIIHRAEIMDISVKTIELDRRGQDGLICADNIRADIKVTFFVRVNKTEDDVLKVAQALGCTRTYTYIVPGHNQLDRAANFDHHVKSLRPTAAVLADHGVRLALEFIGPKTHHTCCLTISSFTVVNTN